jgi:hypothetical protein
LLGGANEKILRRKQEIKTEIGCHSRLIDKLSKLKSEIEEIDRILDKFPDGNGNMLCECVELRQSMDTHPVECSKHIPRTIKNENSK